MYVCTCRRRRSDETHIQYLGHLASWNVACTSGTWPLCVWCLGGKGRWIGRIFIPKPFRKSKRAHSLTLQQRAPITLRGKPTPAGLVHQQSSSFTSRHGHGRVDIHVHAHVLQDLFTSTTLPPPIYLPR